MTNQESINKIKILGRIKEGLDVKIGDIVSIGFIGGKPLEFSKEYRWNISESVIWAINKNKRRFEATIKENEALSKDIQESFFKKYHLKQEDITPENEVETNEKFQSYLATEAVIKLQRDFLEAKNTVEWYKVLDADWDKLTCPDAIRQFLEITLS